MGNSHKPLQTVLIDDQQHVGINENSASFQRPLSMSIQSPIEKQGVCKEVKDNHNICSYISYQNHLGIPRIEDEPSFSSNISNFKRPDDLPVSNNCDVSKCKNDSGFKKPLQVPATPKLTLHNLCQPSTPRMQSTCYYYDLPNTPFMYRGQNISYNTVPFTPLLNEAMTLLDDKQHVKLSSDFPDILQLIDDDSKPVEMVDKQIHVDTDTNIPLCDSTVVDYLLDISNDYTDQQVTNTVKEQKQPEEPLVKRKCRRAKPISYEESLVYHEQKKQREKECRQQRKERFKQKSSQGSRKSSRTKKKIKYC